MFIKKNNFKKLSVWQKVKFIKGGYKQKNIKKINLTAVPIFYKFFYRIVLDFENLLQFILKFILLLPFKILNKILKCDKK